MNSRYTYFKNKKKTYKKKYGGNTPEQFYTPRSTPSLSRHSSSASTIGSYMSADDGEEECPICLENLRYYYNGRYLPTRSLYTTRCNHNYHFDCARRHFMNNTRCPLCRAEIDDFIDRPIIQQERNNDIDDLERRLQLLMDNERENNEMLRNQWEELDNRLEEQQNNITNDQIRFYEDRLEELDNNYQIDGEDAF